MKMKLMKNKKYLQQNISQLVLVPQTTADFTSRVTEREDRGSNTGLATWIFIEWLSPKAVQNKKRLSKKSTFCDDMLFTHRFQRNITT